MEDQTDQDLVSASLAGNRDAFAQLVRRYQDSVFGLAVSMTRNHADAADMAQEAFVRAYTRLDQYDPSYPFRPWLLRICANRAKNLFRQRTNRRRIEEEYQADAPSLQSESGKDYQELESALSRLPARLAMPLRLKYMEDLSYEEVAGVLNIGVSAAKMRVLRARNRLAEMLNYEKA
jgi:RNA polymerase sigma-70 factor (ECF subfamily)